jgi:hypothetical protein
MNTLTLMTSLATPSVAHIEVATEPLSVSEMALHHYDGGLVHG